MPKSLSDKSSASIRAILERGPAVMYHCPEYWDYGIDYISPNIESLTGWKPEDFIDSTVFRMEIIHPDDLKKLLSETVNLFEEGSQIHEYRLRTKSGDYIWVMDDVQVLKTEETDFGGIVGYITDITSIKESEEAKRLGEARYQAIFDTVLEGLVTINDRGIIQDVNTAIEKMFSFNKDQLIGQNVSILMPKSQGVRHDHYMHNYLTTGLTGIIGTGRHLQGRRSDGSEFEMHLSISEFQQTDGRYFVGAIRDISKSVRIERDLKFSQERLRMSQEFANIGTWDWDLEKDETYWSEIVYCLMGMESSGGRIMDLNFLDYVHPDDREAVRHGLIECLKGNKTFDLTHRVRWSDGTIHWVHEEGDVILNDEGRAIRMVGVMHDVTQTKLREAELISARQNAQKANKAKSDFLSRMSHELRTPLNSILGFAQLLSMSGKHPLSERQAKQVEQISMAGSHLLDLINDILDLEKIEAGHIDLNIEELDISLVIDECLEITETHARTMGIGMSVQNSHGIYVLADRKRFKQVLLNLLNNAIKYNIQGGFVRLDLVEDQETIRFEIRDNGRGIAKEFKDRIFIPFNRLGAEKTEIEGTGIGLSLTKELVESMKGTINFESEEGQGSCFWFELPKYRAS
jgi:PAS domain S-box-containing protein